MPRMARVVMPGYPHHVIQRGNRRQKVFFSDKDKFIYMKLLREMGTFIGVDKRIKTGYPMSILAFI